MNLKALEKEFAKVETTCAGDTRFMATASIFTVKTLIRATERLGTIVDQLEKISKKLDEIQSLKFPPMEGVIHGEKESIKETSERREIHIEIKA